MADTIKPIIALCKQCNKKAEMQIVQKPVSFKPIGMYDNDSIPSVWNFGDREKWEAQNVRQAISEYVVVCSLCGHEEHSCYTNASLETRLNELQAEHNPVRHAKLVRAYARKFNAFQATMEKRTSSS